MHTYQSIKADLAKMNINPKGTLLVHSSLKSIGEVEGGAEIFLDALMDYMSNGLLVFPTHTWKDVSGKNPLFNVVSTPSCVGALTNIFMKRKGVLRSLHPTHSVAAYGREAAMYIEGEQILNTPCPQNGCWGKLYNRNATILFIGCNLDKNTYIHSVEEWCNVPDRISQWTELLEIIDKNGNSYKIDMHRHDCSFTDDVSQHYIKLEPVFEKQGALVRGKLGDANCFICSAKAMGDITSKLLAKNPALFAGGDKIN